MIGASLFLLLGVSRSWCGEDHKIYLYADDAKFYNTITSKEDQTTSYVSSRS